MEIKSFVDFNKEIIFGFVGAIIGAPLLSKIVELFTLNIGYLSMAAVLGDIIGGSLVWTITRVYDKNKREKYSVKKYLNDVSYFTPAAFLSALIFVYPTIYLVTKFLLEKEISTIFSVILSQLAAYLVFLISMNIYRLALIRYFKKKL